nr:MAG TPA: hypothetical protein [Caudoviricetes sp.]
MTYLLYKDLILLLYPMHLLQQNLLYSNLSFHEHILH